MSEITTAEIREFLKKNAGRTVDLDRIRAEFNIIRGSKSFDAVRNIMYQLAEGKDRIVKPIGSRSGTYKIINYAEPIRVFEVPRERTPDFPLMFPKDRETEMEFPFANDWECKQGDLIIISGQSDYGKTTVAMNIIAENLDKCPVLMGNEYTTTDGKPKDRFIDRILAMNWVNWTNGNGEGRFELIPVHEDFEDNIRPDRINVIAWIDLEDEPWRIKDINKRMKNAVGKGVVIPVIQKNEGRDAGYGGNPTRFYADLELLIDRHTAYESRITVGKAKGGRGISGRSWAYSITNQGTSIINVREVVKCHQCHGFKYIKGKGKCDVCDAVGWLNKGGIYEGE